jgi:hypothetical protein
VSDGAKTGTDREKLGWPNGEFTVWDDGDPHGSVYVVCPGGKMISFGDCGGVEMDAYRANFVADALNAAFRCKPQSRSVPTSKERREMPLNDAVRNKDLHLETALTEALKVAGEALRQFADSRNWMREGICDPSGMNFEGTTIAEKALNDLKIIESRTL